MENRKGAQMIVISHLNAEQYPDLLDDMFRFRYRVFVEQLGWKGLGNRAKREIDQFDTEFAIHLVVPSPDDPGRVIGCTRFVPTMVGTLTSEYFPHLINLLDLPVGERFYDNSRRAVSEDHRGGRGRESVGGQLSCAVFEFGLALGLQGITAVMDLDYVVTLLSQGLHIKPFGHPKKDGNDTIMAVEIEVSESSLSVARKVYDIDEPVLTPENVRDIREAHHWIHTTGLHSIDKEPSYATN